VAHVDIATEEGLSAGDFGRLRELIYTETGICLGPEKKTMVEVRLKRRLRTLNMATYREYCDFVFGRRGMTEELIFLINVITTNKTDFFREPQHFEFLARTALPDLTLNGRSFVIWSAGCSSGEEPYSTAMTIQESLPNWERRDIRILATDLDSDVLAKGQRGVYAEDRVRGMDRKRLDTFFREKREDGVTRYAVIPQLSQLITFKQLNLMHELPMRGPFDVIFCRNVVIYFDKETQRDLFRRFALLQRPGDLLFLGHSESMFKVSNDYTLIGRTIYKRNGP